jgi:hypothetical protein
VAGRRQNDEYAPIPGAAARGRSRAHQRSETRWSYGCRGYEPVCVAAVIVMSSCPIVYQLIRIGSQRLSGNMIWQRTTLIR